MFDLSGEINLSFAKISLIKMKEKGNNHMIATSFTQAENDTKINDLSLNQANKQSNHQKNIDE